MAVLRSTGGAAFQRPTTFDMDSPSGYFQPAILWKMNDDKDSPGGPNYHIISTRSNCRVPGSDPLGAENEVIGQPAPPTTPSNRRRNCSGNRGWFPDMSGFQFPCGCSDSNFPRAHEYYKNYDILPNAVEIALSKRYGFKKRGKLPFPR